MEKKKKKKAEMQLSLLGQTQTSPPSSAPAHTFSVNALLNLFSLRIVNRLTRIIQEKGRNTDACKTIPATCSGLSLSLSLNEEIARDGSAKSRGQGVRKPPAHVAPGSGPQLGPKRRLATRFSAVPRGSDLPNPLRAQKTASARRSVTVRQSAGAPGTSGGVPGSELQPLPGGVGTRRGTALPPLLTS